MKRVVYLLAFLSFWSAMADQPKGDHEAPPGTHGNVESSHRGPSNPRSSPRYSSPFHKEEKKPTPVPKPKPVTASHTAPETPATCPNTATAEAKALAKILAQKIHQKVVDTAVQFIKTPMSEREQKEHQATRGLDEVLFQIALSQVLREHELCDSLSPALKSALVDALNAMPKLSAEGERLVTAEEITEDDKSVLGSLQLTYDDARKAVLSRY